MKTDELEDGDVCPYCGVLVIFFEGEADAICPNCGSELYNVDFDDNVDGNDLSLIDPDVDVSEDELEELSDNDEQ